MEKITNVVNKSTLPLPHGGRLVNRLHEEEPEAYAHLPAVELSERGYTDLELIATGVYSPLEGFMGQADYQSVLEHLRLANGLPWSIPITLGVDEETARGLRRARLVYRGETVGLLEVEEQYRADKEIEAQRVYRTLDRAHPCLLYTS
ncbi:MAG: sulfate adenylyltransferase, partial [Meiothermus sp.]|nr:sulfate adenylyltransferase [Meiothermus sp.]